MKIPTTENGWDFLIYKGKLSTQTIVLAQTHSPNLNSITSLYYAY